MSRESEKKQHIREQYRNAIRAEDDDDTEIIPAIVPEEKYGKGKIKRVCAYARVSTDSEDQTSSIELQKIAYEKLIEEHENWIFVGLYSDEGITGTNIKRRKGFQNMLEDCRNGKIDQIITKSVARFARNVLDSLQVQRELSKLDPPVGVFFEAENLDSLDPANKMVLLMLSMVAEHESQVKSEIMNWSIDKRFEFGMFLIPKLLGYRVDENRKMVIIEEEAKIVRLCFYLYLNGFSVSTIAQIFTDFEFSRMDQEKYEWKDSTIKGILQNEKYCGEFLARKTYTPDYQEHISKKNEGNKIQYMKKHHHDPIVSRDIFYGTKSLMNAQKNSSSCFKMPVLEVVSKGALEGYIPIDRHWGVFSVEDYLKACKMVTPEINTELDTQPKELSGFRMIDEMYFSNKNDMYMNLSKDLISFNAPCMECLDVENVSLLFHPIQKRIAVIKTSMKSNGFCWGRKGYEWNPLPKSIKGFSPIIYKLMEWESAKKYRIKGKLIKRLDEKTIIFDLSRADESEYAGDLNRTIYPQRGNTQKILSNMGQVNEKDFPNERLIIRKRDCSNIACLIPATEIKKLEKQIEESKLWKN